ncbi:hypothetical protein RYB01_27780, partial [Pseudomonas syringae]|nr:hypothetical protein [Pseudomonas syringae]
VPLGGWRPPSGQALGLLTFAAVLILIGYQCIIVSLRTGAISAVKGGVDLLPDDKKAAVKVAFDDKAMANLKFFANIPPGLEDMEGKALERIKAATSNCSNQLPVRDVIPADRQHRLSWRTPYA